MLNTFGELKAEVLVRDNQYTSTATGALFSDAILNNYVDAAHQWAAAYKKWPCTEGKMETTFALDSEDRQPYPEGWKADGIRILMVGGKRLDKINFSDFLRYREDTPEGAAKIYSDYTRNIYINPISGVSGSLVAYGQYTPVKFDYTDPDLKTVFSDYEPEANEAIVEEALSYAKTREKMLQDAETHHQKAVRILETLWQKIQGEQHAYQTKDRELFKRFDVLGGNLTDELFKRDRFF